jgi:DNA-directed RNA polymerase subunit RPC12/RpoP
MDAGIRHGYPHGYRGFIPAGEGGMKYKCAMCKIVFDSDWEDAEAEEEFQREFPGCTHDDDDVVCDDCWSKMVAFVPPPGRDR